MVGGGGGAGAGAGARRWRSSQAEGGPRAGSAYGGKAGGMVGGNDRQGPEWRELEKLGEAVLGRPSSASTSVAGAPGAGVARGGAGAAKGVLAAGGGSAAGGGGAAAGVSRSGPAGGMLSAATNKPATAPSVLPAAPIPPPTAQPTLPAGAVRGGEGDERLQLALQSEVEGLQQSMQRALRLACRTLRGQLLPCTPDSIEKVGARREQALGADQVKWLQGCCGVLFPHCLVCVFDPAKQDLAKDSPWTVLSSALDAKAISVRPDDRLIHRAALLSGR